MEQNLYHSGEQTCKNCKKVLAAALLIAVCNIWLLCQIMSSDNEQDGQYGKKAQDSAISRTLLFGRKAYVSIRDGREDRGVGDDETDVVHLEEQLEVLRNRKSGEEKFDERDVEGMPLARTEEDTTDVQVVEEDEKVSPTVEEWRNSTAGKEETALLTDETEFTERNGQGDITYKIDAFQDKNGIPTNGFFYVNSTLYESENADMEVLKPQVEE